MATSSSSIAIANDIIALRDPFLPLTPIQTILRTHLNRTDEQPAVSSDVIAAVWEHLGQHAAWLEARNSLAWFEVADDFPYMIAGVARIRPNNDAFVLLQENWRKLSDFDERMFRMTPDEFEALGRDILSWMGVSAPLVSRHSNDAGIDFIGEGRLGEIIRKNTNEWTVIDSCKVLFIGQAKKYSQLTVGTPHLRELIGSVLLMQRDTYRQGYGYGGFNWSLMQPRVLLLITTSRFSADAVKVADDAGIILADRDQICRMFFAKLLSDNRQTLPIPLK